MVFRVLLSTIVGAVIYFLFGMAAWTMTPYHTQTLNKFADEAAVVSVLKAQAPTSGIYVSPAFGKKQVASSSDADASAATQPFVFVSIKHEGQDPTMRTQMICAFAMDLAGAFLISLLLLYAARTGYFCRLSFVILLGLTIGILGVGPYYTWWGFSLPFTLPLVVDYVLGWGIAGLFMAAIIKKDKAA